MTEIIGRLFELRGLGAVVSPVIPVSGGFMHKMYKVSAGGRHYAVKHLSPSLYQTLSLQGSAFPPASCEVRVHKA